MDNLPPNTSELAHFKLLFGYINEETQASVGNLLLFKCVLQKMFWRAGLTILESMLCFDWCKIVVKFEKVVLFEP